MRTRLPIALIALALATACGSSSSKSSGGAASSAASSSQSVAIAGYAFHPASVTVATGGKVTFTNHDATNHTATKSAGPGSLDTGTLKPGQSKTITLATPGTYTYYCQFHAFMKGTVLVR